MDTTVVIEAWTSVIKPQGVMACLVLQSLIVGLAMGIGYALGKEKR